jgi:HK97 family phage major capsid protein
VSRLDDIKGAISRALPLRDADPYGVVQELEPALGTAQVELGALLDGAEARGDGSLLASEQRTFDSLKSEINKASALLDEARGKLRADVDGRRRAAVEAREAAYETARNYGGTGRVSVGHEPGVYHRGRPELSFFRDLITAEQGDYEARDRIAAHRRGVAALETRASGSSALGGLVPPQFLADMFSPELRPGRPFLSRVRNLDLPAEGMQVTIPLSNTPTLVASQTSQNMAVTSQDVTATDLNVPVVTVAGFTDVSYQALDRGHLVDELIFADLMAAYGSELERQAFRGTGTLGQHTGILSTTVPNSITSVPVATVDNLKLVSKQVADAVQRVGSNRFASPSVIAMAPRRWGAIASTTDTTNRPLVDVNDDGTNTPASSDEAYGAAGRLAGIPVVVTAGITAVASGTFTVDDVVVTLASDIILWEEAGSPVRVRFDQPGSSTLTARLLCWGYSAFTAAWHTEGTAVLSGTGLHTPVF